MELSKFTNDQAVDTEGQCCSGTGLGGECTTPCETFFRICLLHFMRDIPTDQVQCTYGSIITPVLGENTFVIPSGPKPEENFINPLGIPLRFDWPVSVRVAADTVFIFMISVFILSIIMEVFFFWSQFGWLTRSVDDPTSLSVT